MLIVIMMSVVMPIVVAPFWLLSLKTYCCLRDWSFFINFGLPFKTSSAGWGKITYTFSANANEFPFHFRLTHPPRLLVPRKMEY
jgi:hypothetical protein